ncbi:MAG TPA: type ISP restriction/modification enzyme [Patescibacteria group bacterium]|nr:type ISP restriction/modification enzyme [Patescibacteria group bacterium]
MMHAFVQEYLNAISVKYSHEETSEIGYRTDFELLLKGIFESIKVSRINHDARTEQGNKPDFVILKSDVPILYIEAKDIGVSLDKIEQSDQMSRYFGYDNLVLTDYVEFRFYRNGLKYGEPIKIAEIDKKNRLLIFNANNFEYLTRTMVEFTEVHKEPIRSGAHLAKIMGGKAQRIRDNVRFLFESSSKGDEDLERLYEAIRDMLVHDLTIHAFSDMYAQTLVYGLFVARYYDKTPDNFSRSEARELIPNSNKFLKHFFDHIVGVDFKSSLKFIVDELCGVYSHADVGKLMNDYFHTSKDSVKNYDPVIHFYEDFLQEYDRDLKKKMGAYYTPQPVVDFIVRSVNQVLKKEFGLSNGIADTSKLPDGRHRVQILDPAVGTGTFISTIIREIYLPFKKNGQEGRWPSYVHNDLLPRLHGFELMMAPYTISHLRLGIEFRKTGFWDFHRRLGIYLTNSLENSSGQQMMAAFGLAESIAEESKEASIIKNETPIMVVVGNPPYSGVSSNETEYANSLVERYKVEPGGLQKLQERKHWLNNDYVKFIALAESMIEKTGDGVVAMITDNGYLDNPTFRGMRWNLVKTFDKIFVLDLHGNAKRQEKSPDGSKDENVFDIMQGVSIILAIKTGKKVKENLGEVYHADLYGTRKHKFAKLSEAPDWQELELDSKMLYFVPKNVSGKDEYEKGLKLNELFGIYGLPLMSGRDKFTIYQNREELKKVLNDIKNEDLNFLRTHYPVGHDTSNWKLGDAVSEVKAAEDIERHIVNFSYRLFDDRFTFYTGKSSGFHSRPQNRVNGQMLNDNLGLLIPKQLATREYHHVFLSDKIADFCVTTNKTKEANYLFPLYIYRDDGTRDPNFNPEILSNFINKLSFDCSPEQILDYIYAYLHAPSYRKKYQEFLRVDFPRVPFPTNDEVFKKLAKLGQELRMLHLFKTPKVNNFTSTFQEAGTNVVEKVIYKDEKVYINEVQYFGHVREIVWNFWMGGYQPARKWLKDRKGKVLSNEDLEHYQRMIVALVETNRIMKEIDAVLYRIV